MPPKYFKTSGHILLCQSKSCTDRGATLLYQALWNHLERSSLAYYKQGGNVRLTSSGCLGACSFGPAACVYRQKGDGAPLEEAWYAALDFPLAVELTRAIDEEDDLPTDGRYGPVP